MRPLEPGSGEATAEPHPQVRPVEPRGLERRDLLPLAAIALLAGWLRLVQIHESLWLDELHSAWTVAGGWTEIGWRAAIGNQSPLYFYLIKPITTLAGLSEVALRLPSAIAGLALVVSAAWLVARWTGSRVSGLLTAALLSVDPHCLYYSQEARAYGFVQLAGLIQVDLFLRLLRRPDRLTRALWIATGLGLCYLHYTAILLLPAQLLAWAILQTRTHWRPNYRWRQVAVDLAILAAGLLPTLPQVLRIAQRRDAWSLFISRDVPVWSILRLFPLDIYLLLPAAICLAAWAGRWLWVRRSDKPRSMSELRAAHSKGPSPAHLVVVACWLFVPLGLAWIATVGDWARLFFLRYVIVSAAAAAVLAGFATALCPGRTTRLVAAAVVTAVAVWHGGLLQQFAKDGRMIGSRQQDWRGAVQLLQLRAADSQPVFVRSGLIEADRLRGGPEPGLAEYCLLPVRSIYRLEIPTARLIPLPTTRSGELTEQQMRSIAAAGGAWFLLCGGPRSVDRITGKLLEIFARRGRKAAVAERQSFGSVAVLRLVIEGPPHSTPAGLPGR